MAQEFAGFSGNLARRGIDRRQIIKGFGITATAAFAAAAAEKATAGLSRQMAMADGVTGFKAVAYNHVNYQVPDYAKARDFYVSLFGMKPVWDDGKQCAVEFGDPPNALYIRAINPSDKEKALGPSGPWESQMGQGWVDHLAFSIENFHLDSVKAELERRGLNPQPDGPFAWTIRDPNGYRIQICATKGYSLGKPCPPPKNPMVSRIWAPCPKPMAKDISHMRLITLF
jgi:catechol 2,3-dioxygenase-like lactoylglutathione lyase family enzyme